MLWIGYGVSPSVGHSDLSMLKGEALKIEDDLVKGTIRSDSSEVINAVLRTA